MEIWSPGSNYFRWRQDIFSKFILSPVQDLVGWRSGLQGQLISDGDKKFSPKFILSPVQNLVGWRSGLQSQIISDGDKMFFSNFILLIASSCGK